MFTRIVVASLLLVFASVASAQQSLSGIVHDSSGGVIPGSTVVVRQQGSAFERIVESGRDGRFTVSPIADGEYTIDVIAAGFAMLNATARVPSPQPVELLLTPAPVVEAVQVVSASRQDELRETLNTNDSVWSGLVDGYSGSQTVAERLRAVPGEVSRRGSETAGLAGEQL